MAGGGTQAPWGPWECRGAPSQQDLHLSILGEVSHTDAATGLITESAGGSGPPPDRPPASTDIREL